MTAPRHLTATGAGEAGDLDLDQGLHIKSEGLTEKPLCKSSPGAYTTAARVTKVLSALIMIQHITKKLQNLHAESFSCHHQALEEVGAPHSDSSPEDDNSIPNVYFHTGADKNFPKTKVRYSARVCPATVLRIGKILHRNQLFKVSPPCKYLALY